MAAMSAPLVGVKPLRCRVVVGRAAGAVGFGGVLAACALVDGVFDHRVQTRAALQVLGELGFNRRHLGGKLRVELGQHAVHVAVHRRHHLRLRCCTQLRTLHPGSSEPWSCPPASHRRRNWASRWPGLVGVVGAQRRLRRQREAPGAVGNVKFVFTVGRRRGSPPEHWAWWQGPVQGSHAQRWQVGCVNVRDVPGTGTRSAVWQGPSSEHRTQAALHRGLCPVVRAARTCISRQDVADRFNGVLRSLGRTLRLRDQRTRVALGSSDE